MQYRKDIDGLRAVAVVAVVLFHAHYETFIGGYVGVDIFFVISGFLITGVILKHDGSTWDFFKGFYERRIRRLFPPMIPVLIFTAAFSYWLMPPGSLIEYAKSLVAFLAFVSNWFFLGSSGYFDGPAHLKPLLHTWSLSIEEQFYLIFPTIVLLLARYRNSAVTIFFAIVFTLSLGYSVRLVSMGEDTAAYFHSLGRFWEIALGSLLATGFLPSPKRKIVMDAASVAGIAMICFAIFTFDGATPFPGLMAIIPTAGTALLIWSRDGVVNRLLSLSLFVAIGLISYALYLWHWPIFVFLNLYLYVPSPTEFAYGICAAIVLSTASYFLIEAPVRRKRVFPTRKAAFAFFVTGASIFFAAGTTGAATGGFPQRFTVSTAKYDAYLKAQWKQLYSVTQPGTCWLDKDTDFDPAPAACMKPEAGKINVAIFGDSHSAHLMPGLLAAFPNVNFDRISVNSCPLVLGGYTTDRRVPCVKLIKWLKTADLSAYDAVIFSIRGFDARNFVEFGDMAKAFQARTGIRTIVFGPIPWLKQAMPKVYKALAGQGRPRILAVYNRLLDRERLTYDGILKRELDGSPVEFFSLQDIFCPNGTCSYFGKNGWPKLIDISHMTPDTSVNVISQLKAHGLAFKHNMSG